MALLDRLRTAVKKLTFLLNLKNYLAFTQSALGLASLIRSRARGRRAISFNDRPGLRACMVDQENHENGENSEHGVSDKSECSSGVNSPGALRRSQSYPFEEDVDKQADMFIDNFYKHLIFEKQVSLNLRYCRDNNSSFDYSSVDSSVVSPLSSTSTTSQLVSPT